MSSVVSGILVIAIFLLTATVIFYTLLDTGATQGKSLRESSEVLADRLGTLISITSATPANSGDGTDVTVAVENKGAISVSKYSDMDVLTQYTNQTGDLAIVRLSYVTGAPGDNEWSLCSGSPEVCSISPDAYNPNIWDSDETATLSLRLVPLVSSGTYGVVVVAVPVGVSDSTTFLN